MPRQLLDFVCRYKGKEKTVSASNPLSACKKAFRSPEGWHWERCYLKSSDSCVATVQSTEGKTFLCYLEDNG